MSVEKSLFELSLWLALESVLLASKFDCLPKMNPTTYRYSVNFIYKTMREKQKKPESTFSLPVFNSALTEGLLCAMLFRNMKVSLVPGWNALTITNCFRAGALKF